MKLLTDDTAHDTEALNRVGREARIASSLNHPNICTIHDIGEQDGRAFIAMEYVEGCTLRERIAEHRDVDRHADPAGHRDCRRLDGDAARDVQKTGALRGAAQRRCRCSWARVTACCGQETTSE